MEEMRVKTAKAILVLGIVCLLLSSTALAWEFPPIDFEGQTINLFTWWSPIFDENRILEAEETFNVNIVQNNYGAWSAQAELPMARLLAGESAWDVWFMSHDFYMNVAGEGVFYRMNEILPQEYYDSIVPETGAKVQAIAFNGN